MYLIDKLIEFNKLDIENKNYAFSISLELIMYFENCHIVDFCPKSVCY